MQYSRKALRSILGAFCIAEDLGAAGRLAASLRTRTRSARSLPRLICSDLSGRGLCCFSPLAALAGLVLSLLAARSSGFACPPRSRARVPARAQARYARTRPPLRAGFLLPAGGCAVLGRARPSPAQLGAPRRPRATREKAGAPSPPSSVLAVCALLVPGGRRVPLPRGCLPAVPLARFACSLVGRGLLRRRGLSVGFAALGGSRSAPPAGAVFFLRTSP